MSERLERVLEALPQKGRVKSGNGWKVLCPAHNDKAPSLRVAPGETADITLHCFAGCETSEVLKAAGLKWSDLGKMKKRDDRSSKQKFVSHELYDHQGDLVATHHRVYTDEGKRIWWTDADGNKKCPRPANQLPLYGSEKLALAPRSTYVVVTEGETDADALEGNLGPLVSLGTVTGASDEPTEEVLSTLKGRKVILWPDNDEQGRSHMRRVAEKLYGVAASVQVFRWNDAPPGGGGADWPIPDESAQDELISALLDAPEYKPRKTRIEGAVGLAAYTKDFLNLVDARVEHDGITGIRTGIEKMDKGLGGLNEDTLTVIAASSNDGKSLIAGQVGIEAAKQGVNTTIISTEQWPVIYLDRWAHVIADVSYERGKEGNLKRSERKDLEEAVHYISSLPLQISYGSHTVDKIREIADKNETQLLIVDYVQLVTPDDRRQGKTEQVEQVSHDLATLKGDLGIAMCNTAQLSRAPLTRKGEARKPGLGDINWGYGIVQDADAAILMFNPFRAGVKNAEEGVVQLYCDKHRFGYPWWTEVKYKGDLPWLVDMPRPTNKGSQERMAV